MNSTYGTKRLACILLIIRLSFVSPNCSYLNILMLYLQVRTPYTLAHENNKNTISNTLWSGWLFD